MTHQQRYWYRNAVFYIIDVSLYCDSDGDGIGDFAGLESRLEYLLSLGVTCIWLLPFYRSQRRDAGYDVSDYYQVDERLGGMDGFLSFMHRAKEHGIRVIVEMVMAHTGDDHPWFLASQHRPRTGIYANYYVWADNPSAGLEDLPSFPGEWDTVWSWSDVAGRYYFHRFYPFQPALNTDNDLVLEEMCRVLEYWLAFGVDGFRLDALAVMLMPPDRPHRDPSTLLKKLHDRVTARDPAAILLAEVNLRPRDIPSFLADGTHVNMLQNFLLRGYLLLSLVRQQAAPLLDGLDVLPVSHDTFQWLSFLSSHDELNIEWLHHEDAAEVLDALAPEPAMRAYGRGMRRRLAPLIGDTRQFKLLYSLLFSLPGAPAIMWGDEIGIGDDLARPGRLAVRPIMQWDAGPNGGFSEADPTQLMAPPIPDGDFGYRNGVNVVDQSGREGSTLEWFRELSRARRMADEIGDGQWRNIPVGNEHVFGIRWHHEDNALIAVHNFSSEPEEFTVSLTDYEHSRYDFFFGIQPEVVNTGASQECSEGGTRFRLPPYGYTWWRKP